MIKKAVIILILSILVATSATSMFGEWDFYSYAESGGTKEETTTNEELTIRVGYFGSSPDYVEVKKYSLADLHALGVHDQSYSWIDSLPAPVMQATRGVYLRDLIADAGIDIYSVSRYDFRSRDAHEPWSEMTSQALFDTPRYFYPNLVSTWDPITNWIGVGVEEGRAPVEAMLAVEDYWERSISEPDYSKLHAADCYRLVFGMPTSDTKLAHDSIKWIKSIDLMLVGSPPDDFGKNDEDDLAGSDQDNNNPGTGNEHDQDKDKEKDDDNSSDTGNPDKGKDTNDGTPGATFAEASEPTIRGVAQVRETLTAYPGTWSPTPTYEYQWYAEDVAIARATNQTYQVKTMDVGKRITVKVTGRKSGYTAMTKTSAPTEPVAPKDRDSKVFGEKEQNDNGIDSNGGGDDKQNHGGSDGDADASDRSAANDKSGSDSGTGGGKYVQIGLAGGDTISGKELSAADTLKMLALAGDAGGTGTDSPWTAYEISPDTVPFKLPPPDMKMVAVVLGLLVLAFIGGGVQGYMTFNPELMRHIMKKRRS
ncbi:MAG: hypothetical protein LBN22_06735 [Clostridiales Family XIII bacterium]|jgi:hypothetical protein|nr:hypothetical protein [Clostridiales Family XIII bacterium]